MSKLKIETDRLSEPVLGLTLHAWRVSVVVYLIGSFAFRLHFRRQPGCTVSRACLNLLNRYITIWR
jgi:hypothetical protein